MNPNNDPTQNQNNTATTPEATTTGMVDPAMPQAVPPVAQPIPTVPLQKSKSNKLVIILLIVVLLVAAGVGAWWYLTQYQSTNQSNNSNNNQQSSAFDPAVELAAYLSSVKTKYTTEEGTELHATDGRGVTLYSDKISRYVTLISPANWSGFVSIESQGSEVVNTGAYNDLVTMLKAEGLTEYTIGVPALGDGVDEATVHLAKDDIVCKVSPFALNRLSFACVNLDDLDTMADAMKPFVDVYAEAKPEWAANTELTLSGDPSDIEKSTEYDGYETMRLVVGNAGGGTGSAAENFYRVDGGDWVYAYGGQDAPDCTEFDNEDVRKAFVDSYCYGADGSTTVRENFDL